MGIENRRSTRLALSIPIEISYTDPAGQPQLERTQTLSIDRHGARIISLGFHPVGAMIHLAIPHLGRSTHCHVVWCSAPVSSGYEVGLEMEGEDNVWGMPFQDEAIRGNSPEGLAQLVQMLEERGVIGRGEWTQRCR